MKHLFVHCHRGEPVTLGRPLVEASMDERSTELEGIDLGTIRARDAIREMAMDLVDLLGQGMTDRQRAAWLTALQVFGEECFTLILDCEPVD